MNYCQDCRSKITGRIDKKFCGDQCRSHYNNGLNKNRNAGLKRINTILRKNDAVLKKFITNKISLLTKHTLITAGFDFQFFTHYFIASNGLKYSCCYNYGYQIVPGDQVVLIALTDQDK